MYRILIVDDEKLERNGIKFLLKKTGTELEVFEASNGRDALEFLKHQTVEILLTDIKMPYVSGLELAEKRKGIFTISGNENRDVQRIQ